VREIRQLGRVYEARREHSLPNVTRLKKNSVAATMFPMMEIEMPPSAYALRMRPWFITTLVMLLAIVIGKFVISDYWGAVSLIFVVLMGMLVMSAERGINATNALFYSVMAMISGIFDVISCMLYFQHSKYKLFEDKTPKLALMAQVVFIISPIALFISAALSYSIFSDCRNHSEEFMPMGGGDYDGFQYGGYGGGGGGMRDGPPRNQPGQGAPRPPAQGQNGNNNRQQPFVPFQGQGRNLANA